MQNSLHYTVYNLVEYYSLICVRAVPRSGCIRSFLIGHVVSDWRVFIRMSRCFQERSRSFAFYVLNESFWTTLFNTQMNRFTEFLKSRSFTSSQFGHITVTNYYFKDRYLWSYIKSSIYNLDDWLTFASRLCYKSRKTWNYKGCFLYSISPPLVSTIISLWGATIMSH